MKAKHYIVLIWLSVLILLLCRQRDTSDVINSSPQESPDQEMWDFKVTMSDKGYLDAILIAGHMSRFEKKSLALFDQGVKIDFYNIDGEIASTLTSMAGELDEYTKNVKATGHVVVVSDSGMTLYTEELFYYNERGKIISNVDVAVTTEEGDTLRGIGFESDTRMDFWEIKQPHDGVSHTSVDLSFEPFASAREDTVVSDTMMTNPDTLIQGSGGEDQ